MFHDEDLKIKRIGFILLETKFEVKKKKKQSYPTGVYITVECNT